MTRAQRIWDCLNTHGPMEAKALADTLRDDYNPVAAVCSRLRKAGNISGVILETSAHQAYLYSATGRRPQASGLRGVKLVNPASERQRVWACLTQFGPQTSKDVAERLGMTMTSATAQCSNLRKQGVLYVERVVEGRPRNHNVWAATGQEPKSIAPREVREPERVTWTPQPRERVIDGVVFEVTGPLY